MRAPDERADVDAAPEVPDLDGVTSYEDEDAHVICDRENPNAWVRAEDPVELEV